MSRQGYATPLRLEPRSAPWLSLFILFIHLGAVLFLALAPVSWFLRIPAGVLIILSAIREIRPRSDRLRDLTWLKDHWIISCLDGTSFGAELLPETFFTRWLVILHLKRRDDGGKERMVLLPGSLDQETFRRLRVRLRFEGLAKEV